MCDATRRDFLAAGAATFLSAAAERELLAGSSAPRVPPPGAQEVAPGIFFYESDPAKVGSNSGWVIFDDYMLVIDTTYASRRARGHSRRPHHAHRDEDCEDRNEYSDNPTHFHSAVAMDG